MKSCDAKKTVYNIQGHTENTLHQGKFLKMGKFSIEYFFSKYSQIWRYWQLR